MEIRPTGDGKLVAKPTRPGWKAAVVFIGFFAMFIAFMTSIEV